MRVTFIHIQCFKLPTFYWGTKKVLETRMSFSDYHNVDGRAFACVYSSQICTFGQDDMKRTRILLFTRRINAQSYYLAHTLTFNLLNLLNAMSFKITLATNLLNYNSFSSNTFNFFSPINIFQTKKDFSLYLFFLF